MTKTIVMQVRQVGLVSKRWRLSKDGWWWRGIGEDDVILKSSAVGFCSGRRVYVRTLRQTKAYDCITGIGE